MTYLKGIVNYTVFYRRNLQRYEDLRMIRYNGADFGGDMEEAKSISGFVFLFSDGG